MTTELLMPNTSKIEQEEKELYSYVKTILWEFVRYDLSLEKFEKILYSNEKLEKFFTKDVYLKLISLNYKDKKSSKIVNLRLQIYEILTQYPENCACLALPNNSVFYPFDDGVNMCIIKNTIENLILEMTIKDFSGAYSRLSNDFYYPAELRSCLQCHQHWFIIFEEYGADYYMVRINKTTIDLMKKNNSWPNKKWPKNLKNWHAFLKINFQSVNALYENFPTLNIPLIAPQH